MPPRLLAYWIALFVLADFGATARAQARMVVPALSDPRALAIFEKQARALCGPTYAIRFVRRSSAEMKGASFRQTPPGGTSVTCDESVTVTRPSDGVVETPGRGSQATFPIGNLGDPDAVAMLGKLSNGLCGRPPAIQTLTRPSNRPPGAFEGQSPPPNTIYSCGMQLTRVIAGPQPRPASFPVGNLGDPNALAVLQKLSSGICGRPAAIGTVSRQSNQPEGSFLGQSPAPSTIYSCGMQLTRVVAAPQPPQNHFPVGNLNDPGAVATLWKRSNGLCGRPAEIETLKRPSNQPAGAFLGQSPAPDTIYGCGMQLTKVLAAPSPKNFFPVGNLGDPKAVAILEKLSDGLCGVPAGVATLTHPSVQPEGSFLGQSPVSSTIYACDMRLTKVVAAPLPPPPSRSATSAIRTPRPY